MCDVTISDGRTYLDSVLRLKYNSANNMSLVHTRTLLVLYQYHTKALVVATIIQNVYQIHRNKWQNGTKFMALTNTLRY